ncbi:hypothetical protein PA598K_01364 [Paenibacillus sp. 598K]|uniref:PcfJ domain-containing protein n=1 Tax=Paenibacillus sp. 598K TaxID=1117987 RepID=UPI000FF9CAB2|nr:PcfJ domain-containing protein [Paenibacillus sp. 598K]GBF73079.1 hypothetical protein PA598K_01364 [Paenibacillus sp. 598K]
MKKRNEKRQAFMAHFSRKISPSVVKYAETSVLPRSSYIFIHRNKLRMQYAYCTACNVEYATNGEFREKSWTDCWKCKAKGYVRASGRSRSKLRHSAYFVYYEKSLHDPQTITATGYWAERDYRQSFKDVSLTLEACHRYIFRLGEKARMFSLAQGDWYENASVRSLFGGMYYEQGYTMVNRYLCKESIQQAVQGTPYQYSMWEHFYYQDMVKFFASFSLYPCMEYLTKLGMRYFVEAKLYGCQPTYGAINWKGTSVHSVLRINKQQLKEIDQFKKQEKLHPLTLRLQQIVSKEGRYVPLSELQSIAKKYDSLFNNLKKILKYTTLFKALNYVEKQREVLKRKRNMAGSSDEVLTFWKDYVADCLKLDMDPKDEQILFPRDIHEAHQKTLEKVKYQADAALNAKIAERLPALCKKYEFQLNNLFIRPFADTVELVREGNALKHCVGGYSKSYADGSSILMAIRESDKPDTPFYTLEIRAGKIVQCRGFKNQIMTPAVEAFVERFKQEKMNKKQIQEAVAV